MPTENTSIPTDAPQVAVTLLYLCKRVAAGDCGGLMYLQGIRSGTLAVLSETGDPEDTLQAKSYHANLPACASLLANGLSGPLSAVLSPPSRFPHHAKPFREAVLAKHPDAIDISDRLTRSGGSLSGEEASFQDILAGLSYRVVGDESGIMSVVIVDDVFSRGRTAAAIVLRLRDAGLPTVCLITVAFPLWLPRAV